MPLSRNIKRPPRVTGRRDTAPRRAEKYNTGKRKNRRTGEKEKEIENRLNFNSTDLHPKSRTKALDPIAFGERGNSNFLRTLSILPLANLINYPLSPPENPSGLSRLLRISPIIQYRAKSLGILRFRLSLFPNWLFPRRGTHSPASTRRKPSTQRSAERK